MASTDIHVTVTRKHHFMVQLSFADVGWSRPEFSCYHGDGHGTSRVDRANGEFLLHNCYTAASTEPAELDCVVTVHGHVGDNSSAVLPADTVNSEKSVIVGFVSSLELVQQWTSVSLETEAWTALTALGLDESLFAAACRASFSIREGK